MKISDLSRTELKLLEELKHERYRVLYREISVVNQDLTNIQKALKVLDTDCLPGCRGECQPYSGPLSLFHEYKGKKMITQGFRGGKNDSNRGP